MDLALSAAALAAECRIARCRRRRAQLATGQRPAAEATRPDVAILRDQARALPQYELYADYLVLGGNCDALELDAFLHGALELPDFEIVILAHAIWERTAF